MHQDVKKMPIFKYIRGSNPENAFSQKNFCGTGMKPAS